MTSQITLKNIQKMMSGPLVNYLNKNSARFSCNLHEIDQDR